MNPREKVLDVTLTPEELAKLDAEVKRELGEAS